MPKASTFLPARIDDAAVLAELVNYAGEGLPLYLWGKLASVGETAWDVGRLRAARETGSFSYRNATIIEHAGHVAAASSVTPYLKSWSLFPRTCQQCLCRSRSWKTLLQALGTSTCSLSCLPIAAVASELTCCSSQTTSGAKRAVVA